MHVIHSPSIPRGINGNFPGPRPIRIVSPQYVFPFSNNPNFQEITMCLANGLPCSSIDPQLYPYLIPHIESRKKQFQYSSNEPALQSLNNATQYIIEYNAQKASEYNQENNDQKDENFFNMKEASEEEIQQNLEYALNHEFGLMNENTAFPVIMKLHSMLDHHISNRNYAKANEIQEIIQQCHLLDTNSRFQMIASSRAVEWEEKSAYAQENLVHCQEKNNQIIAQLKASKEEEIRKIREDGKRSLEEFDKQYKCEIPPKFRKYSSTCLQQRRKLQACLQTHRYQEAKELQIEVEQIEKEEREGWQKKYFASLNANRAFKVKSIEDAVRGTEQRFNGLISARERRGREELVKSQKLIKRLEIELEEAERLEEISSARLGIFKKRGDLRKTQSQRNMKKDFINDSSDFRQKRAINQIIYTKTPITRPNTVRHH